jgi:hypothetical protein
MSDVPEREELPEDGPMTAADSKAAWAKRYTTSQPPPPPPPAPVLPPRPVHRSISETVGYGRDEPAPTAATTRFCSGCHKDYPATKDHFYASSDQKDGSGLYSLCKTCFANRRSARDAVAKLRSNVGRAIGRYSSASPTKKTLSDLVEAATAYLAVIEQQEGK